MDLSKINTKKERIWWRLASWGGPASCRSPTKGAQPCAPTDRLEACPTTPHQLRCVSTTGAKLLRIGIVATNRVRQHMTLLQKNRKASLLWQNTSSQAYYCERRGAISRHSRGDGNPGRAQSHAPLHDRAQFKVCRNIKNGESMKKMTSVRSHYRGGYPFCNAGLLRPSWWSGPFKWMLRNRISVNVPSGSGAIS